MPKVPDGEKKNLNAMRLQLQKGGSNIWSGDAVATSVVGVSISQIRNLLTIMHSSSSSIPNGAEPFLYSAIMSMSQKLNGNPPSGILQGGNVDRVWFSYKRCDFRIDLENLHGHNLKY